MSKWTDIRDGVVDAIELKTVGKSIKDDFIDWLSTEGLEVVEVFADRIIKECKDDAPMEQGWCKIRDAFVVPLAINGGMYVLRLVIDKSKAEA